MCQSKASALYIIYTQTVHICHVLKVRLDLFMASLVLLLTALVRHHHGSVPPIDENHPNKDRRIKLSCHHVSTTQPDEKLFLWKNIDHNCIWPA